MCSMVRVYPRLVECGSERLQEDGATTGSEAELVVASGAVTWPGRTTPIVLLSDQIFWL